MPGRWVSIVLTILAVFSLSAPTFADVGLPGVIDVQEHLGVSISRDIELQDEFGRTTTTGDLFAANRPVILVLAYYRCPMLCPVVLNGVIQRLQETGFSMGNDYRLVTVSIDPEDKPADARKRKDTLRAKIGAEADSGAHFLVGRAEETRALADAVGFRYVFDAATNQYAHPAVIMVLGSSGQISRYVYGPEPSARDLRLALTEAGEGRIGGIINRVLVACYRFDPATRRYGPQMAIFLRGGALIIFVAVGGVIALLWRIERRRNARKDAT
jgi:protein SCO1